MGTNRIAVGERLPSTQLAELEDDEVKVASVQELFGGQKVIIIGLPGAFTPVCTRLHIPGFVEDVPALRRSGFDQIVCVAPNSPWALNAWAKEVDPCRRLRFLSDGNLDFGRAIGLTTRLPQHFVGECFQRFLMVVKDCVVERMKVERSVLEVDCTSALQCRLAA